MGEVDVIDEKMNHLTNGRAKNGSSVHLLDAPVMVNTADMEGTGSIVQPSASASADISRHTKMNSPSHRPSFQSSHVAVSILL